MLRYLVEHPGRLVTKAELRQHVWAGTHVSDTVLRVCVQEIRVALCDAAAAPRYLETVGRQGYRFLGGEDQECLAPVTPDGSGPLVGRQEEVAALERWFQRAADGARQVVFVSGEVGVGKTTVVEVWQTRLEAGSGVRLAWGQCVEHMGAGESYLPLLQALGQLCRGPRPQEVLAVLRQYAPLWLVQLPGVVSEPERERLQRQVEGTTSARMLRELVEALDVLSAEAPLVLVLEDLQWSDHATVEALAGVSQQRTTARLLVVGTYRPVEAMLHQHPLRGMVQELCGRGRAVELRLELLPAPDVAAYVAGRLGGAVATDLATFVHERTEGNALFMVNSVAHLVQQGLVVRRAGQWTLRDGTAATMAQVPEALQQLLRRRIEALRPETRQTLEVASVVGREFTAVVVAAGAQCPVEDVEAQCETLAAQQHFLVDIGLQEWPDTTSSGCYRFAHVLYRQVLYEGLGTARRQHVHRRIGTRLEAGYGAQAKTIAPELARHFECGGELQRAVHYWQQAAENAARRNAYPEALAHLTRGMELLVTLPDSLARARSELSLQLLMGGMLIVSRGLTVPEVGHAYTRAQALCQQVGDPVQHCQALWGLVQFYRARTQLRTAAELGQQLLHLAQRQADPVHTVEAHRLLGVIAFYRGALRTSQMHLEHSLQRSPSGHTSTSLFLGEHDPRLRYSVWSMRVLLALGYAAQAQQHCHEAEALVQQDTHLTNVVFVTHATTLAAQYRRDTAATLAGANAVMAAAAAQGFGRRVEYGRILRGWALAMQGETAAGLAQIQQGLTATQAVGPTPYSAYFLTLLAEASDQAGQPEAGLRALDEAATLMTTTDGRWWEAEGYRLRGALLLHLPYPDVPQADACFHQALAVARAQQAKILELRAATSLSRLWQRQGKWEDARALLAPLCGWFTEGFDTADLQEAKALLEELG
jgi:predicted ATPase